MWPLPINYLDKLLLWGNMKENIKKIINQYLQINTVHCEERSNLIMVDEIASFLAMTKSIRNLSIHLLYHPIQINFLNTFKMSFRAFSVTDF